MLNISDDNNSDDERSTSPQDTSQAGTTEDQYLTMVPTSAEVLNDFQYDYVDSIRMTGSVLQSVLCSRGSPRRQPHHRQTTVAPRAAQRAPEDYRLARKEVTFTESELPPSRSRPVKTQGRSSRVRSSSQPRCSSDKVVPPTHGLALLFPREAPVLRHVETREMGKCVRMYIEINLTRMN